MTYLELVQRLHEESGLSGDPPTTLTGALGIHLKLATWIKTAWEDIQNMRKWDWMWARFQFSLTPGVWEYDLRSDPKFDRYGRDISVWLYDPDEGAVKRSYLTVMRWLDFESVYPDPGALQANRPQAYTVTPEKHLLVAPVPDKAYVMRGEFYQDPQVLSSDTDTPELDAKYHMLIVWRAATYVASHYAMSELFQFASGEFRRILSQLEREHLPEPTWGSFEEPLA